MGSRTLRRITRSVLILTTAGNTLATARTAGSAAGSAWAAHDDDPAINSAPAQINASEIFRGITMGGLQITRLRRHCQLAARRNHRRLNASCPQHLAPERTST